VTSNICFRSLTRLLCFPICSNTILFYPFIPRKLSLLYPGFILSYSMLLMLLSRTLSAVTGGSSTTKNSNSPQSLEKQHRQLQQQEQRQNSQQRRKNSHKPDSWISGGHLLKSVKIASVSDTASLPHDAIEHTASPNVLVAHTKQGMRVVSFLNFIVCVYFTL
jgi:hypothetical protein